MQYFFKAILIQVVFSFVLSLATIGLEPRATTKVFQPKPLKKAITIIFIKILIILIIILTIITVILTKIFINVSKSNTYRSSRL